LTSRSNKKAAALCDGATAQEVTDVGIMYERKVTMSSDEFVRYHREALAFTAHAYRRARKDAAGMPAIQVEMQRTYKDEVFAVSEYLRLIEWQTGARILSETRAQARREGRNVN